jgi:hypothetical protein
MKPLLTQEFEAARVALLKAAAAIDALRLSEAEECLRTLRSICDVIVDLLEVSRDRDGTLS